MKIKIILKYGHLFKHKMKHSTTKINYMKNHLKNCRHDITEVEFLNGMEMLSEVNRIKNDVPSYFGVNSEVSQTISLLEWLIIFSQMSQVLAYNFDDIERKYSDTFWMREVKAALDEPYEYTSNSISVSGGINKTKIISMKDEAWRTFDMAGETFDGILKITAKIAHKIPKNKEEENGN